MKVILLSNGNLLIPADAEASDAALTEPTIEITPEDPRYARWRDQAVPEQQAPRRQWPFQPRG